MKSVFMIAYHFPPEGNAGAYRPLRFVRHLRSFGWHPTVITVQAERNERYDPSLLKEIPADVEVIRVRNPDPWQRFLAKRGKKIHALLTDGSPVEAARIRQSHQRPLRSQLRELLRSLEAWSYHPDLEMGWIGPAVKAVQALCADKRPDAIWATAGPVSSFHVAATASHRTGIPYLLDFRDAWTITFNEFEARRPPWAIRRDRHHMFRFLKGSQAAFFRSHAEAECYYRAYQGSLEPSKIYILPNGFEGDVEPFAASHGAKCEFLYTGTLGDYRYDTLLQAIGCIKASYPTEAAQMHFHFVGEGSEAVSQQAEALNLKDIVTTEAAVSQAEAVDLSKKAHALLLLGRPALMKGYELFAAAKLFGYLKAGKPIAGILPPDEAKQILRRVGCATAADVDSQEEIIEVLRRVLHCWREHRLHSLVPDVDACRAYSAENQTRTLVAALEGAPASDPFVPGRVEVPISLRDEINQREKNSIRGSYPYPRWRRSDNHSRKRSPKSSTLTPIDIHNDLK